MKSSIHMHFRVLLAGHGNAAKFSVLAECETALLLDIIPTGCNFDANPPYKRCRR